MFLFTSLPCNSFPFLPFLLYSPSFFISPSLSLPSLCHIFLLLYPPITFHFLYLHYLFLVHSPSLTPPPQSCNNHVSCAPFCPSLLFLSLFISLPLSCIHFSLSPSLPYVFILFSFILSPLSLPILLSAAFSLFLLSSSLPQAFFHSISLTLFPPSLSSVYLSLL